MRRPGEGTTFKKLHHNRHQLKQVKELFYKLAIAAISLIAPTLYFVYFFIAYSSSLDFPSEIDFRNFGLLILMVGDHLLFQDLTGLICNAVLAARIMNATLVLPELDANSYWHDDSGFQGLYDVHHFIKTLQNDVRVIESIPEIKKNRKTKKIKAFQLHPPRDAPINWYTTIALEKMKEHGAIYLTPFSHRLAEEIDNPEYPRLRCRVNYHALIFKPHIMELSHKIVNKLRSQGHFLSIHLRFEMDMLSFAGL